MANTARIISLIGILILWGCSKEEIPFVYRIDIQQGNVVTQDMLAQLKPGQDKRLVSHIMGTPLIVDVFNQDQWIYLYSFQKGHQDRIQRRISLYFEDDLLDRIGGDIRPAAPGTLSVAPPKTRSVDVPPGSGDEDGGFLRSVMDTFTFEPDKASVDPAMDEINRAAQQKQAEEDARQASEDGGEDDEEGILSRLRRQLSGEADQAAPESTGGSTAADDEMRRKYSFDGESVPPPAAPQPQAPAPEQAAGEAPVDEDESFFESLKKKLGMGDEEGKAAE